MSSMLLPYLPLSQENLACQIILLFYWLAQDKAELFPSADHFCKFIHYILVLCGTQAVSLAQDTTLRIRLQLPDISTQLSHTHLRPTCPKSDSELFLQTLLSSFLSCSNQHHLPRDTQARILTNLFDISSFPFKPPLTRLYEQQNTESILN